MSFFDNQGPFDNLFDLDNDGRLDFLEGAAKNEFFWGDNNVETGCSEEDFNSDEWDA